MRRVAVFSSVLIGILSCTTAAFAQLDPRIEQFGVAAENTMQAVLDRIQPILNPLERTMIPTVRIRVDRNDWNVFGTRVFVDGGRRMIVV